MISDDFTIQIDKGQNEFLFSKEHKKGHFWILEQRIWS